MSRACSRGGDRERLAVRAERDLRDRRAGVERVRPADSCSSGRSEPASVGAVARAPSRTKARGVQRATAPPEDAADRRAWRESTERVLDAVRRSRRPPRAACTLCTGRRRASPPPLPRAARRSRSMPASARAAPAVQRRASRATPPLAALCLGRARGVACAALVVAFASLAFACLALPRPARRSPWPAVRSRAPCPSRPLRASSESRQCPVAGSPRGSAAAVRLRRPRASSVCETRPLLLRGLAPLANAYAVSRSSRARGPRRRRPRRRAAGADARPRRARHAPRTRAARRAPARRGRRGRSRTGVRSSSPSATARRIRCDASSSSTAAARRATRSV